MPVKPSVKPGKAHKTDERRSKVSAAAKSGPTISYGKEMVRWATDERTRFVLGLILGVGTLYLLLAFVSFFFTGADDQSIMDLPSWHEQADLRSQIVNWTGVLGAILANVFMAKWFGVSAFAFVVFLAFLAFRLMRVGHVSMWRVFFQCAFWLVWLSITIGYLCASLYASSFFPWGGEHGRVVAAWLNSYISPIGTGLLLLSVLVIFCIFSYKGTLPLIKKWGRVCLQFFKRKEKLLTSEIISDQEGVNEPNVAVGTEIIPNEWIAENRDEKHTLSFELGDIDGASLTNQEADKRVEEDFVIQTQADETIGVVVETKEQQTEEVTLEVDTPQDTEEGDPYYNLKNLGKYDPTLDLSHYEFPSIDLLKIYPNENAPVIDMVEQNANKDKIVNTLRNYGIEIESIKATVGPTITLYEIVPKAGIRISKIRNLESDIMLSLAATGIRIIAPIPGKGTIGIEVPNEKPQIVSMHSVIASKKFQEESKYALPVALGRTITNEVFMFDLAKTPHLLVAGATGQGKSVGLNAIITSLLYKKHPSQLKFVLVDPKMVEFNIYAALEKHYMAKMPDEDNVIITDSTKVIQTLNSLVVEMEDRYKLLMSAHCRNIVEYNEKFVNRQLNPEKGHRYLPYIVIVIDEFGDLIMVAGKEIEMPISRITQKARAVGMHMILATQRPSVNIITGVIKANVPGRIAFRVSSMIDSRTILDAPGANQLVGKGDLLYSGGSDLVRVQCAFVDTPEVENIVNYVSQQQAYPCAYELPEYVPETEVLAPGAVDMSKRDPKFEEIARWVVAQQQGSTSAIQRTFEIGYNRAGRISDQLEAAGIVSSNNGSKGRQVLVQDDYTLTQILESL